MIIWELVSLDGGDDERGCEYPWKLLMLSIRKLKPSKIQLYGLIEDDIKALIHDKESHVKILVEVGGMSRVDSAVH